MSLCHKSPDPGKCSDGDHVIKCFFFLFTLSGLRELHVTNEVLMSDILKAVSLSMPTKTRLCECSATDNSEDEYEANVL